MNIETLEKIAKKIPVASKAGIRPSVLELTPFLTEFLKEYEQSKQNKERDELKAHCESLRNYVGEVWSDHSQANRAKFIYKQTPQQSLAEIKAQAIKEYEQRKQNKDS
jgi:dsRNA-specific ribonuclease